MSQKLIMKKINLFKKLNKLKAENTINDKLISTIEQQIKDIDQRNKELIEEDLLLEQDIGLFKTGQLKHKMMYHQRMADMLKEEIERRSANKAAEQLVNAF